MNLSGELSLLIKSLWIGGIAFAAAGAFRDLLDAILMAIVPATERAMMCGWQLIAFRLIYFTIVCALLVCLVVICA
jgi:hypothetical protein